MLNCVWRFKLFLCRDYAPIIVFLCCFALLEKARKTLPFFASVKHFQSALSEMCTMQYANELSL